MRSSVTLFRLFGIDVNLHTSFLLFFFVILAVVGVDAFIYFSLIFVFVLGHELSHSLVAKYHGIDVPEITLTFIGGIASIDIPEKPSLELRVSLAGPLFNLVVVSCGVLALSFLYPGWLTGLDTDSLAEHPYTLKHLLVNAVAINLMLGLFNVLPGFPMDGGRIFRSLLAYGTDYVRATEVAVNVGRYLMFPLFVIWGLASGNLILVFIAFILYFVSGAELQMIRLRASYHGVTAKDVMHASPRIVDARQPLGVFLEDVGLAHESIYFVTEDRRLIGYVDPGSLTSQSAREQSQPVRRYARNDFLSVDLLTPIPLLLRQTRRHPVYIVAEAGRMRGFFTLQELLEKRGK